MQEIVKRINTLSQHGESIISEEEIGDILNQLLKRHKLDSYINGVKLQYFPMVPDTKFLYNFNKNRIEYYMFPIEKYLKIEVSDQISEDIRVLYISYCVLVEMLNMVERVRQVHIKSNNMNNYEDYLLYLILRYQKIASNREVDINSSIKEFEYSKLLVSYRNIYPVERLSRYYAYKSVLSLITDETLKSLLERDFYTFMEKPYQIYESPTGAFIDILYGRSLITKAEYDKLSLLHGSEEKFKYGLKLE